MPTFPIIDGAFLASLETLSLYIRTTMNGRLGGVHPSHSMGSSTDFIDYREYMPGDDLRRLDWNLVARLDQYYIKQFAAEQQQTTRIYLDVSASMASCEQKACMALRLAAAVGFLSVKELDRVSYRLLQGSACREMSGTFGGMDAYYRAAKQLGALSFVGETLLGDAIRADPDPGFNDGLSIVISDFFTDSNWQSAVDFLLSRKREVVLIRLISPEEAHPEYSGPSLLLDAESPTSEGLRLRIDRGALQAYRQAVACFEASIASFCSSRGITLIEARSDEPIEQIILQKGLVA